MYKIYYTDSEGFPVSIDSDELKEALNISKDLRKEGYKFVTMVSEDPNQVGNSGVDGVENGKLPDGTDYTWVKRRRAG